MGKLEKIERLKKEIGREELNLERAVQGRRRERKTEIWGKSEREREIFGRRRERKR